MRKKRKKVARRKSTRSRGRPPNFPFHLMAVGGKIVIPWMETNGMRRENQKVLYVMVWRAAKRLGFTLKPMPEPYGLSVTRVA